MIATQIFISMVVLISSVHFITCPAVASGGATKPNMSQFAVVSDKPDTTPDMLLEGETHESNIGQSLVSKKVRTAMSKSVGFLLWPVKKSWKIIKGFMPIRRNMSIVPKNMVNGEVIN
ncbi:uncharacterized protein LOC113549637 [Rhopalosiphum maidis]|uniref:uncharacterized protein LOC113549637 n=1 Tax=Rhopalosiphum maidis TaxID=43146 RepID=UPI000EFFF2E0|nr:uncharacterized protein LOC113549637 [Rhopalosiphum maidis]